MARHFLAGLAAEPGVVGAILGDTPVQAARAAGLSLQTSALGPWPVAVTGGAGCAGVIVTPDAEGAARLAFALAGLGLTPVALPDLQATGWVGAGAGPAGPLDDWARAVMIAGVQDILRRHGQAAPAAVAARLPLILVRAASRLRAGAAAPATLRHATRPDDLRLARERQPYAAFFAIEEYDLAWRRFDGAFSDTVTRAVFLSGDAVTVLPYDPVRDRVLVVEQFRAGPLGRGGRECWQIEPIAGRVDPFETPEEAGRREAVEEAGLHLDALVPVARYFPSVGAVAEFLYSYVALCDLPDGIAGVFGEAEEAEDIRGHVIPFARLMELVTSGEIENAPLILTALWLERERPRLRG